MVRIKMCGMTTPHDAAAAAEAGATSIGIIAFESSPRYLRPSGVSEIRRALPPWVSITVVAPDAETASHYDADFWQLYKLPDGDPGVPMIHAIRVDTTLDVEGILDTPGHARALLFDAYHPHLMGGSGISIDDSLAARIFSGTCQVPRILAGGLTPENIARAISMFSPWAVDVSSGIELSPGVKCPAKMQAFADAAFSAHLR